MTMKSRLQTALVLTTFLYALYLLKTGLGIDLVSRYHAPRVVKLPLKVLDYGVEKIRS